jgi:hypothetical protein
MVYVHGKLSLPLQESGIGTDELLRLWELLMRCCGNWSFDARSHTSTSLTETPPILSDLMEVVGVKLREVLGSCRWLRRKLLRSNIEKCQSVVARLARLPLME